MVDWAITFVLRATIFVLLEWLRRNGVAWGYYADTLVNASCNQILINVTSRCESLFGPGFQMHFALLHFDAELYRRAPILLAELRGFLFHERVEAVE